jgi:hypothetical protein
MFGLIFIFYANINTTFDRVHKFNIYRSVHFKSIPIYIQQDPTLHSIFISGNCSSCFGWYLHPSSGAHTTVSTAFVICHTVTATCRYRGRVGTAEQFQLFHPKHVEQFPDKNKLFKVVSFWIYI